MSAAGRRPLVGARLAALAALAASGALLGLPAPAAADHRGPTAPEWVFRSPGAEGALVAMGAVSTAAYLLPQRRGTWAPYVARPLDPRLDAISDITGAMGGSLLLVGGAYLFEASYYAEHRAPEPFARALRTSLIDVEAVLLTSGIVATLKRLAGRCRPRSWKDARCSDEDEEYSAFPSGHTAPVAAIAGVHLSLAARTPGHAGLRLGALGLAEAATLVTMALRIGAGAHSWEDVGAGFLLGHVTGVAIGYAHPMVDLGTAGHLAAPGSRAAASPGQAPAVFTWSGVF